MTRFLNISTDNTLGGSSPSDEFVASQKAIKYYVDNNSSNVQVDNLTITTNASDEIQTVATINQNSGILKFWKGTKLEYDNLPSHDPDTQYTVTGDNTAGMMPTGSIIPFAGTNIPDGYLLCDGSAISRTTYADLFAVIGTVYGTGDGSTTFNLPTFRERSPWFDGTPSNAGAKGDGVLPNITGYDRLGWSGRYAGLLTNTNDRGGCFASPSTITSPPLYFAFPGAEQVSGSHACGISFIASNSNPIYGGDHVVPRYQKIGMWAIKY